MMTWLVSGVRVGVTDSRRTRRLILTQFSTEVEALAFAAGLVEVVISEHP